MEGVFRARALWGENARSNRPPGGPGPNLLLLGSWDRKWSSMFQKKVANKGKKSGGEKHFVVKG